ETVGVPAEHQLAARSERSDPRLGGIADRREPLARLEREQADASVTQADEELGAAVRPGEHLRHLNVGPSTQGEHAERPPRACAPGPHGAVPATRDEPPACGIE